MSRRLRLVAVAAALLLALPAVPQARADHGTAGARDITDGCPPEQVPSNEFGDLEGWDPGFVDAVDCIVAYAVTYGVTATSYAPGSGVSREQMASFLVRTLGNVDGYERPGSPPDAFPEDGDSVHHDNINVAAAEAIATGYPDGAFRPKVGVTRAQMASFVERMLRKAGASVPVESPDAFPDDDGSAHEPAINALADVHVVVGESSGGYGPNRPVTRAQMALFLARSIDYLVAEARLTVPFDPTAPREVTASPLSTTAIRVTWLAPTEGTPDSYNVYRVVAPGGGDCPTTGYEEVGTVAAADGLHFDDAVLTAGVTYCYRVTAVAGTQESAFSILSAKARATTAVGPQMVAATVDTDAETVTVTYGEAVTCASGAASQFSFGGSSSTTPTGITCADRAVVLTFSDATGGGELTYRQSVDQPSIRVKQSNGDVYAISPQTVDVVDPPPFIESAEANIDDESVVVTYSEPVTCLAGSWGQFSYTFQADGETVTRGFEGIGGCDTSASKVVTLSVVPAGLLDPPLAGGTLHYAQAGEESQRLVDEGGNFATSPDSKADQIPRMVSAVADTVAATNQVIVTFSEAVTWADPGSAAQFEYQVGSNSVAATDVNTCSPPAATCLRLTFGDGTGVNDDGTVGYTPGSDPANHVVDKAGRAADEHSAGADARPWMVSAKRDDVNQRLLVTYSEPVDCVVAGKTQFKYNPGNLTPDWILCDGTSTMTVQVSNLGSSSTSLVYTQAPSDASLRVRDGAGNTAPSPQTLDLSWP